MRPAPSRLPVLRRPPARVLAALLLAVVVGLLVHRLTSTARATVERWGPTAEVWVAAADLPVGHVLGTGDLVLERRPVAFVPAEPPEADPSGRMLREGLRAGEVVTVEHLGDGDALGIAALVPDGWRAVAVPVFDAALPLQPGQRVDVVAAGDPGGAAGPGGTVVAAGAVVVHVDDEGTVTVAVPAEKVTRVAAALVGTVVTLALAP